ncbi:MAG: DUF427 domain-containing protein [Candidatus Kapaibacterium sp.]
MRAKWNDIIIAESDNTQIVEGNHYFPRNTIKMEYFDESRTHTTCVWKGEASYFDINVNGQLNKDAAWYYPEPKDAAKNIKNMVAFWKGVEIIE